jgi:hypothetical protein
MAIELPDARVEALVAVVREFDEKTLAGYRARKRLKSVLKSRALYFVFRNIPAGANIGLRFPRGDELMEEVLAAKPLDPDKVEGLYDLDDVDVAEGLVSFWYGRRAWAVGEVAKLPVAERRTILLDRARNDPALEVCSTAIECLEGDTDEKVKALLRDALKAPSQMVRSSAVVTAISVLGEEGRKILKEMSATDRDVLIRMLAKQQLKKKK